MKNETININVIVADRPYRLKVKPAEEATVRKAAKMIKDKMRELQKQYEVKDKQDFLAMSALMFAVETLNTKNTPPPKHKDLSEKLNQLDGILTEFVGNT